MRIGTRSLWYIPGQKTTNCLRFKRWSAKKTRRYRDPLDTAIHVSLMVNGSLKNKIKFTKNTASYTYRKFSSCKSYCNEKPTLPSRNVPWRSMTPSLSMESNTIYSQSFIESVTWFTMDTLLLRSRLRIPGSTLTTLVHKSYQAAVDRMRDRWTCWLLSGRSGYAFWPYK